MTILAQTRTKPDTDTRNVIFESWWNQNGHHCLIDKESSWYEFDRLVDDLRGGGIVRSVRDCLPLTGVPDWAEQLKLRDKETSLLRAVDAYVGDIPIPRAT